MRLLVVDDDVDIAETIRRCLEYEGGYEVEVAHDGLEALKPHCIITDLIMPWMNGYQIMRCLAVSAFSIMPMFVVVSALAQLEMPIQRPRFQEGVVAYMQKPFTIESLLSVLHDVRSKVLSDSCP